MPGRWSVAEAQVSSEAAEVRKRSSADASFPRKPTVIPAGEMLVRYQEQGSGMTRAGALPFHA
jgi:hypothetical protein